MTTWKPLQGRLPSWMKLVPPRICSLRSTTPANEMNENEIVLTEDVPQWRDVFAWTTGLPKLLIAVWTAEPDQRKCNHEFTPNVVKYVPDEYRLFSLRCLAALVSFAYAKIIWFAVIRTMQVTKSCATKLGIYFKKKMRWKYRCVQTSRSIAQNEFIWKGNRSPSRQAMSTQTVTCQKID